jgi:hypothetical protein
MQHSNKTTSKTKPRSKKRYTAAQKEEFKLISRYESELRAEAQARADQREWECHLAWLARNNIAAQAPSVPAPALQSLPVLPALNFTAEATAILVEMSTEQREQYREELREQHREVAA